MINIIHVVGDGFVNFSKNTNVIRISDLEEIIRLPRIGKARNGLYVIGQGISPEKIRRIKRLLKENKINDVFIKESPFIKEGSLFAHKRLPENIMISKPLAINDALFVSKLMVDDCCAEMSDHLTGQHVQGMVLIEAARQMILSVSENFFLSEEERFKSYFVLQNVQAQFKQFVFPIDVELQCKVIAYKKISVGKFTAKCAVEFVQNNIPCMQVNIDFMADEKTKLENKEGKFANLTVQLANAKEEENLNQSTDHAECGQ